MSHSFKAAVVSLALVILAVLGSALMPAPAGRELDIGGTISLSALLAPRVTIAPSALRELRDRMARFDYRTGISITGPYAQDPRAPGSIEEAWLTERLYGRPQRWVLSIIPLGMLAKQPTEPGESIYIDKVSGLFVSVLTTQEDVLLSVELYRDALRVYEIDA